MLGYSIRALVLCSLCAAAPAFSAETNAESVAAAVRKSCNFLIAQQNEDGTFGKSRVKQLPGMVGMALKALAHGPDKLRESNPAVAKAVKFLLSKQLPSGAIADASFGQEN